MNSQLGGILAVVVICLAWRAKEASLVSIAPPPPVLTLDSYVGTTAVMSWTIVSNECLPISSYNIYKNGELLTTVRYTTTSITINNVVSTDTFYVTSLSDTIESLPSNTISVT